MHNLLNQDRSVHFGIGVMKVNIIVRLQTWGFENDKIAFIHFL